MKTKNCLIPVLIVWINLIGVAGATSINRSLSWQPVGSGEDITVNLTVDITGNESYYAIDELIPGGWSVKASGGGSLLQAGHIKWVVISGAINTVYTYVITSPTIQGTTQFTGYYLFEGDDAEKLIGGQSIITTTTQRTISGNTGVGSVTLGGLGVTSDGSGDYTATVSDGWSGTVTPSKTGYTFTPPSRTYSDVTSNQTSQNYTAALTSHTISGNTGVGRVTLVTLDGLGVTSDGSGNYTATVSDGWSGTVTPSKTGYTFTPLSRTYSNITGDQLNQNYTAQVIQTVTPCYFGSFNGQKTATLTLKDCNNNDVSFSLTGGGYGEINCDDCSFSNISLYDTTEKSILSLKTKSNIRTNVGDIICNGPIKGINAKTTAFNGSISIGASSNPKAAVTITFDRTDKLNINSQMPIMSISATEWLGGSINAPLIGSITTKGDKKRGIAGDLDVNVMLDGSINSVNVAGTLFGVWECDSIKSVSATDIVEANLILSQQPDTKILALGKLTAKGWIDSSQILSQGNIGTVTAGAMINSTCFAGISSASDLTTDGVLDLPDPQININYVEPATIKLITIKGIKAEPYPYVINSNIAAAQILSASLVYPENNNGTIPFGLSAGFIKLLKIKDGQGTKSYKNLDTPKDNLDFGDVKIRLY